MSWSVSADGSQDDVKKKLANEATVPAGVVTAIGTVLEEFSIEKTVTVTTHGHHDGGGGGNATIAVQTTN
jgi:hypothetical protein